jgi:hypothetical protein
MSEGTSLLQIRVDPVAADEDMLSLRAKVKERTIPFKVPASLSVGRFKELILDELNEEGWLRLIYSGRMLSNDDDSLSSCKVQDGTFVHCSLTGSRPTQVVAPADGAERRQNVQLRGFNRLQSVEQLNLSGDEVMALRLMYHDQVQTLAETRERAEEEQQEDFMLRMEEEWLATQGPGSEIMLNLNANPDAFARFQLGPSMAEDRGLGALDSREGESSDLILGMLFGSFLGPIMLLFVCGPSLPRKQKVGILLGISCYFMMAQRSYDPQQGGDKGG